MKARLTVAGFVVVMLGILGPWWVWRDRAVHAGDETEESGKTVRARGVVDVARRTAVVSEVDGTATVLDVVPEGTRVEEGEVVVRLDTSELEERERTVAVELARAEADVTEAVANLESAESLSALDRERASLALKLAELDAAAAKDRREADREAADRRLELAQARHEVARLVEAETRDDASQRERFEARAKRLEAELELVDAERDHRLLKTTQQRQATALRLAVVEAERERKRVEVESGKRMSGAKARAAATRAIREREAERLKGIERQIAACTLRAPHAGIVTYPSPAARRRDVPVEAGTTVRERQPIVHVTDPTRMEVRVRVDESQVAAVRAGQSATVYVDAFPDQSWPGLVKSVSRLPVRGFAPRSRGREYDVTLTLPADAPRLKPGLTAVVEIDTTDER